MKSITVDVDIDIDDIISDMSERDRAYFFRVMQESGYIDESLRITNAGEVELPKLLEANDTTFNKAISKLYDNRWKLTTEEEDCIINIANKLV